MNDIATPAPAAPAAAPAPQLAPQSVPIDSGAARAPNPVERSSPGEPQQKEMPLERVPIDEAIRRADAKATAKREEKEAAEKAPKAPEPKAEAKPAKEAEPKAERPRAEDGKFASREGTASEVREPVVEHRAPYHEPPARFLQAAKAEWPNAPDSVKEEIHRHIKNFEQGIQQHRAETEKYRGDAEAYNDIREFAERAEKSGTTLKHALTSYVSIDDQIHRDPIGALDRICRNVGLSLQQVAAHVMGQPPEQQAARDQAEIRELRAELAEVKKEVGAVKETNERQQTESVLRVIEDFKRSPGHERFDELQSLITVFLESGEAKHLDEAYEMANGARPAADAYNLPPPIAAESEQPNAARPAPLNPAGTKSISGAPATGSNPEGRKKKGPAPSIDESIKRAQARVGSR